jgi:Tfp pilus assembly protein PilF
MPMLRRLFANLRAGNKRAATPAPAPRLDTGPRGQAERQFREILARDPLNADALIRLAFTLYGQARHAEARALLERLVGAHPGHVEGHNFLAVVLAREFGEFAAGEACARRALQLQADFAPAAANLGWILTEQHRAAEGLPLLRGAMPALASNYTARFTFATSLLKAGHFEEGWREYESRYSSDVWIPRPYTFPRWDGQPLAVGRLLVVAEQGLGDQVMFASCMPDVLRRAPDCVLECDPRLEPLMRRSFPGAHVRGGALEGPVPPWPEALTPIAAQIPAGSLPGLFRNRLEDFPRHSGYLVADPERVAAWRARLAELGSGPVIGVSWRGGSVTSRRDLRSMPLDLLAPVAREVGATLVSLQYTDCADELRQFHATHGVRVHHWQDAIDDYDQTAALVCALDAVVSVCTSIVHLTGALGRPGLVLVPFAAEWRYGDDGDTMPWYPSVRLFRQPRPLDWLPVVEALRGRLAQMVPTP